MKVKWYGLVVASLLLVTVGCGSKGENESFNLEDQKTSYTTASNQVLSDQESSSQYQAKSEDVIVKIGKTAFTSKDFLYWLLSFYQRTYPQITIEDVKKMWEKIGSEDKKGLYDMFVFAMKQALLAKELGLDRDPEVQEMIKINTMGVLQLALVNRLGEDVNLTKEDVARLYDEAIQYKKAGDDNAFLNSELVKLLTYAQVDIMALLTQIIKEERTIYEIVVDSSEEADKVMAEYYQQKAMTNSGREAFRMVARKYMGPNSYKKVVSASDLYAKMMDPKMSEEERRNLQLYFNFIFRQLVNNEDLLPMKTQIGGKWYIVYLVKSRQQIYSWDELDDNLKEQIYLACKRGKEVEELQAKIQEFDKRHPTEELKSPLSLTF